jgi:hypothetical protein
MASSNLLPGTPRITADIGGDPCLVIPEGKLRRYRISGISAACRWTASSGLAIAGDPAQPVVDVTGSSVSQAVDDQQLTVTTGHNTFSAAITVVGLRSITATVGPTPPIGPTAEQYRASPGIDLPVRPPATFESAGDNADFPAHYDDKAVLVLLRGDFPDVPLTATVAPPGTRIGWRVTRNQGDNLPEHQNPLLPTLAQGPPAGRLLRTDATGAFVIRAYPLCTCGQQHDDMTVTLRVVLVQARLESDRTEVSVDSFVPADKSPFVDSGEYGETETATITDTIRFDTAVRLISGGADGRMYIDSAVDGYWCNNIKNEMPEVEATYTGGKGLRSAFILERGSANAAHRYRQQNYIYTAINGQLWDGVEAIETPKDILLARSESTKLPAHEGSGMILTAIGEDHPNDLIPLKYPVPGPISTLTWFRVNQAYVAGLYLWSASAPWTIGIVCTVSWGARLGYNITASPPPHEDPWAYSVTERSVTKDPIRRCDPVLPADRAGIQVWEPGGLQHAIKLLL